jgi:chemotaxis protein CheC
MKINLLEYDILKELFNVAVGKAASMLSEIVNKKILLDIPKIELYDMETSDHDMHLPKILKGTLMVSSIDFGEKLNGTANLIFPASKMRKLLNLCLNNNEAVNSSNNEFNDIDYDIMKEIGNIVLNSILGEIGNYLNIELEYSIPEVKIFQNINFKKDINNNEKSYVLFLYITFIIDDIKIEGTIIIDLTLESLKLLMVKIGQIEAELNA